MTSNPRDTTHHATADLKVTPFLDILLVLLVTCMMIVMAGHATMDVQLPQPCAGICESPGTPIVLEVGPAGRLVVNGRTIPVALLVPELTAIYRPRQQKLIFVRGFPGASFQEVVAAMGAARSAGVRVIGIDNPPSREH